jgi:SMI1 / KNR4 family (SUKH-1)
MEELLEIIAPLWFKRMGASAHQIAEAEAALGVQFPPDYRSFLSWSNGGEGQIGSRYLNIWNSGEIRKLNDDYQIGRYLPGIVGIGTDGGGATRWIIVQTLGSPPRSMRLGRLGFRLSCLAWIQLSQLHQCSLEPSIANALEHHRRQHFRFIIVSATTRICGSKHLLI